MRDRLNLGPRAGCIVRYIIVGALALLAPSGAFANLIINLNAGAGLLANTAALTAFGRAAQSWEVLFSDPITVTIDADLTNLGSSTIIGQTNVSLFSAQYTDVRQTLINKGAGTSVAQIENNLPISPTYTVPGGWTANSTTIRASAANLKALGFTGLTGSDGAITFNSGFAFDYDNSNGVTAGTMDFQTVAAHEIGHALGFISSVDTVDQGSGGTVLPMPLDLFRFSTTAPGNLTDFSTAARDLTPGGVQVFGDTTVTYSFSTGVTLGDGRQASHWKDDALTGVNLGIMDPTLATGVIETITSADMRAFQDIGWNLAVPEPGTLVLVGACLALVWRRHRRAN